MIFVTGGTGFLGSHLLYKLIKAGKTVKALMRAESNKNNIEKIFAIYESDYKQLINKIQWVEGELNDICSLSELIEGCEYIYHCAAYVSFDKRDNDKMYKANVEGTRNIINAALENKSLKKFCHVSSIASLGPAKEGNQFIDESCEWEANKKLSFYSRSKYESEMEVWRGINEGLEAVIVLPSVILGAGNWNEGSSLLLRKGFEGQKFYTTGINGFVDVEDVVNIMIELTENNSNTGNRYILNSENLSYQEFFSLCALATNIRLPSIEATPFMTKIAYLADSLVSSLAGKKSQLTKQAIRIAFGDSRYSNKKIKELLGHKFVSIEESITKAAEIYLKEKKY